MPDPDSTDDGAGRHKDVLEARRESVTMALYIAIVLLAEAVPLQTYDLDTGEVIGTYWGSTIGLAIAHVYAFTLSARLFSQGHITGSEQRAIVTQLVAAAGVAFVATIPFVFLDGDAAFNLSGSLLAILIGATGFEAARAGGAPIRRAILIGAVTLVVAAIVVAVKATLSH
jgi:hypothetical protein